MAEAMIAGVIGAGVASPEEIKVGEPMEGRREHLKQKYHIRPLAGNSEVVDGADVVVLADQHRAWLHFYGAHRFDGPSGAHDDRPGL